MSGVDSDCDMQEDHADDEVQEKVDEAEEQDDILKDPWSEIASNSSSSMEELEDENREDQAMEWCNDIALRVDYLYELADELSATVEIDTLVESLHQMTKLLHNVRAHTICAIAAHHECLERNDDCSPADDPVMS